MIQLLIETKNSSVFNTLEYTNEGLSFEDCKKWFIKQDDEYLVPDGFEVIESDDFVFDSRLPQKDGYRTEFRYNFESKEVYETYIPEVYLINDKIKEYTQALVNTDYKIIKAYEAYLVDKSTTYNFDSVHSERQQLRDKINELQQLLLEIEHVKE